MADILEQLNLPSSFPLDVKTVTSDRTSIRPFQVYRGLQTYDTSTPAGIYVYEGADRTNVPASWTLLAGALTDLETGNLISWDSDATLAEATTNPVPGRVYLVDRPVTSDTVPITSGGTGADNAADARTNIGLQTITVTPPSPGTSATTSADEAIGQTNISITPPGGPGQNPPFRVIVPGDNTIYTATSPQLSANNFIIITPALTTFVPSGTVLETETDAITTVQDNFVPSLSTVDTGLSGSLYREGAFVKVRGETTDTLTLESTDTSLSDSPDLVLMRESSSPADGDEIGVLRWEGRSLLGGGSQNIGVDYAELWCEIVDSLSASREGALFMSLAQNGDQAETDETTADFAFRHTGLGLPAIDFADGTRQTTAGLPAGGDITVDSVTFGSAPTVIAEDAGILTVNTGVRTRVEGPFQVEGCIDIIVPELTVPTTPDGLYVGNQETVAPSFAGEDDAIIDFLDGTGALAPVGTPIIWPTLPNISVKITTNLTANVRGTSDRVTFTNQPLEETIPTGTAMNVPPNALIFNKTVNAFHPASGAGEMTTNAADFTSIVIFGDLTASLDTTSSYYFQDLDSTTSGVSRVGVFTPDNISFSGGVTTLSFNTPVTGGTGTGVNFGGNIQLRVLTGSGTRVAPATQVATIERDITEFHSQNIELDVTLVTPDLSSGSLRFRGLKTGTLATPPTGMAINETWLDTTDSATHPQIRISTVTT